MIKESLAVLSTQEIERLYSRDDYKKMQVKDPSISKERVKWIAKHVLEHLFAFRQSDQAILKYLEGCKGKMEKLNGNANAHEMSVLHLAVLTGRVSLIGPLIGAGANPEAMDCNGWRPIHHAALRSDEMFQELIKGGADPKARTSLGGTTSDLRQVTGLDPSIGSLSHVYLQRAHGGPLVPAAPDSLPGLKEYADAPRFSGENLKLLWGMSQDNRDRMQSVFDEANAKAYQKWLESPPKLSIRPIGEFEKSEYCYGLYSEEKIAKGTVIGEYSGEYVVDSGKAAYRDLFFKEQDVDPYLMSPYDQETIGNATRYANDGFPNAFNGELNSSRGLHTRYFIMAFEEIGPGEQIFFNYEPTAVSLKWGRHVVLNGDEMHQFYRTQFNGDEIALLEDQCANSFRASLLGNAQHCEGLLDQMFLLSKLHYALTTPSAFIELVMRRTIAPGALRRLYQTPLTKQRMRDYGAHIVAMVQLTLLLEELEAHLRKCDAHVESAIRDWFYRMRLTLSVKQQVKGIQRVVKEGVVASEGWRVLAVQMEKELPAYIAKDDPNFPLEIPIGYCSARLSDILRRELALTGGKFYFT